MTEIMLLHSPELMGERFSSCNLLLCYGVGIVCNFINCRLEVKLIAHRRVESTLNLNDLLDEVDDWVLIFIVIHIFISFFSNVVPSTKLLVDVDQGVNEIIIFILGS